MYRYIYCQDLDLWGRKLMDPSIKYLSYFWYTVKIFWSTAAHCVVFIYLYRKLSLCSPSPLPNSILPLEPGCVRRIVYSQIMNDSITNFRPLITLSLISNTYKFGAELKGSATEVLLPYGKKGPIARGQSRKDFVVSFPRVARRESKGVLTDLRR